MLEGCATSITTYHCSPGSFSVAVNTYAGENAVMEGEKLSPVLKVVERFRIVYLVQNFTLSSLASVLAIA